LPDEIFLACLAFEVMFRGLLESSLKILGVITSAVSATLGSPAPEFLLSYPAVGGLVNKFLPEMLSLPMQITGDVLSLV
jgi:hypothetical protein